MDREDGDILKAVTRFLDEVQSSGMHLVSAYLYGSHAAGTARPDDARIEPVRFRPDEFCDEHPLVWEIKSKGRKRR